MSKKGCASFFLQIIYCNKISKKTKIKNKKEEETERALFAAIASWDILCIHALQSLTLPSASESIE